MELMLWQGHKLRGSWIDNKKNIPWLRTKELGELDKNVLPVY